MYLLEIEIFSYNFRYIRYLKICQVKYKQNSVGPSAVVNLKTLSCNGKPEMQKLRKERKRKERKERKKEPKKERKEKKEKEIKEDVYLTS